MRYIIVILLLLLLSSCASTPKINGKLSKAENNAQDKIELIQDNIATNVNSRLDSIGEFSYGISIVNSNDTVSTLNDRISSLANKPSLEAMKEMQLIVGAMASNNLTLLQQKDKEIIKLQENVIVLNNTKEKAIKDYMKLAENTASKADSLSQLDSFWGLSAVWYGLKKFISRFIIGLSIFGIGYVVLRVLSISNPIAASIFGIFDLIGSWIINIVKFLAPKAIDTAKLVAQDTYQLTEDTLSKIIQSIEKYKATAAPIKDELSKVMDTQHKQLINKLK